MTRYRTIVADPPWPYNESAAPKGRAVFGIHRGEYSPQNGPAGRYALMSMDALEALAPPADDDAHLYLWTTNSFLVEAHELARAWGFAPKTMLTWGKVKCDGTPSMKTGHYFRGATEHCLFCVRGSLKLRTTVARPTLYLWPRLPHSVKPDAFFDLVEAASPGPYLEMFARRRRMGWNAWGNEIDSDFEMAA